MAGQATVVHIEDAAMRLAVARASEGANGVVFLPPGDRSVQYLLNKRIAPSEVERHAFWDDLMVVRSGAGILRYGGATTGDRALANGERRGGTLRNPSDVPMRAGDILRIPAGTAHQVMPAEDQPLVYVVIKVRSGTPTPARGRPQRAP